MEMMSEWKLEEASEAYSVDHFYTQCVDEHHHSAPLHLRVPPWMKAAIEELVASRAFPYRRAGDVVRDALVHRFHQLEAMGYRAITDPLRQMEILHSYMEIQTGFEEVTKIIVRLRNSVNDLESIGADEAARIMVKKIYNKLLEMDESHWRNHCLKTLIGEFADYLRDES
jgi:Arc/MetJ-type ribon-helix-helix transcriptional regulator